MEARHPMFLRSILIATVFISLLSGCGINSVTKAEIESIKAGNKITYRYKKGDKSWFYADKVTRVDEEKIYYNASKSESTSGTDVRLDEYDTTRELSIKKADIIKYETEQPPDEKKIVWIQ